MKKTPIVQAIYKILRMPDTQTHYVDKRKTGVRVKISSSKPATKKQVKRIKALSPHVIKVGYRDYDEHITHIEGITIHLDRRTTEIKL